MRPDERIRLLAKAVGITAIAYVLSLVLTSPFSASISSLFASGDKADFSMSDLFFEVADGRPVRQLEDRMVVLNIGNSNRYEIADILSTLALCGPSAVALDVNFELPGEDDSQLIDALRSLPNLVLPVGVGEEANGFVITDKAFFLDSVPYAALGVVNFPTRQPGGTVREFARTFKMADGSHLPSLPMAVAGIADPKLTASLTDNSTPGIISYFSKEIPIVDQSELIDKAELFADKIVLVGSTGEAADLFPTPIRNRMSGLEIHAYALSSLLDGAPLRQMPSLADRLIGIAICFLMVFANISIKSGIRGLVIRFAQLLALYLLVRIGYSLLVDHATVADFSYSLLMVAFGLFAVDLWNGSVALWKWLANNIRKLLLRIANRRELT